MNTPRPLLLTPCTHPNHWSQGLQVPTEIIISMYISVRGNRARVHQASASLVFRGTRYTSDGIDLRQTLKITTTNTALKQGSLAAMRTNTP